MKNATFCNAPHENYCLYPDFKCLFHLFKGKDDKEAGIVYFDVRILRQKQRIIME